jgi:CDP-4-dehydro-6-deoxyglucose reductase/3-phenylpropionate/trans-cinnamate dioxygenase ferredoxin reductase subunit
MIRNAERDFQALGGLPQGQFFADPFVSSGNPEFVASQTISNTSAGQETR